MNGDIALWLIQDGVTSGAIYALLALALLLVFAVTRIIFVPQGDFISYAGLTLGTLQLGQVPGTIYLLAGGAVGWVGRWCVGGVSPRNGGNNLLEGLLARECVHATIAGGRWSLGTAAMAASALI